MAHRESTGILDRLSPGAHQETLGTGTHIHQNPPPQSLKGKILLQLQEKKQEKIIHFTNMLSNSYKHIYMYM